MPDLSNCVVFFDIGNTLASVRTGPNASIEITPFPDVVHALQELREHGAKLGIISNRGDIPEQSVNDALKRSGLLQHFTREFIIYGPKDSPLIFEQAAALVRQSSTIPDTAATVLAFVGEDATERAHARAVNYVVIPHPILALKVLLRRAPLRFLRIRVPELAREQQWQNLLRQQSVVPVHSSAAGNGLIAEVYAIADSETAAKLDDLGFWVDRLGKEDEPLTSDLYILRDDRQRETGFLDPGGNSFDFFRESGSARQVLTSTTEGLFVAIPAGRSVESYHFAAARHGHNLKLLPSPTLLEPLDSEENERLSATVAAAETLLAGPEATAEAFAPMLTDSQKATFTQTITANTIKRDVERYTGVQPVHGTTKVFSRHIHHPSNATAVNALIRDLTQIGNGRFNVRTHRFTHEGRTYNNVEAIFPASGLPGVVLITAHMDSTGSRQAGYRASTDDAPGADDDASGVAAVLSTARALSAMTASINRREVRFVLFNAEEHGLIGSRAYAREQALINAKIVAVFQMDMIGFDQNPGRTFELHFGFTPSVGVQQRSAKLAKLITALIPEVSPTLPLPQLYPSTNQTDPAESRSDHYSFQREGYAACLASEDFFVGPNGNSPAPDPNPNYHLPADKTVNPLYAADITRAVAAAAWIASTR
ncbi:MAG TPA: M20/M25/M40 family metallo-hydrolase [Pyrinomonadaceae bacterium]|nr:M20/M25/M40 family metallo-hydrolase [Pyrinomonadaceae bacterium]